MQNIQSIPSKIWEYDIDIYNRLSAGDFRYSQMPDTERKFINGMLRYFKPRRILELGVCLGGGTVVILNAIADMPQTRCVSIDILTFYNNKPIGYAAESKYPNARNWQLITGQEPSEAIDELAKQGKFDFAIIDTGHKHPVEMLNFLTILPHLTDDAIVIVQDTSLFSLNMSDASAPAYVPLRAFPYIDLAPKLLFDVVVGDKITLPTDAYRDDLDSRNIVYSNIGAFQVNGDTWRYVGDLFRMLEFPWGIYPRKIDAVGRYLEKHYDADNYAKFGYAMLMNATLLYNRSQSYRNPLSDRLAQINVETVVFYGCGQNTRAMLKQNRVPICPDVIWDANADEILRESDITFLRGIPLTLPDYDCQRKDTVAVILTLSNDRIAQEVRQRLEINGFSHIFNLRGE